MEHEIKITYRDEDPTSFQKGVSLYEISKKFQNKYNYKILAGKLNNNLTDLNEIVDKKAHVDFFDRSSAIGQKIYESTVHFMLIVAAKRLFGKETHIRIEHSIDNGVYCEVRGVNLDRKKVEKIEKEMHIMRQEDLKIIKISVSRLEAIAYFKKIKEYDKISMLKYLTNRYVELYRLDDVYDYFFTEMAYSTNQIDSFKLTHVKNDGFILSYPDIYNPEVTLDYKHHKYVFDKFLDYTKWGETIGIDNASDLNEIVSIGKYNEIVRLAECKFDSQLANISNIVYENKKNIKLVLIAGPSSSGKTTTSRKLAVYLQTKGFKTHAISIDDYFLNREDTPKLPNGEYDFESVRALDLDLFNKHLTQLLEGKKVLLPEYNFVLGKKEFKKRYLEIKENDIIVIEGLHALNEKLTEAIDKKNKFNVYIGPLTQLNIDNHNRIHTTDIRKLRRIVRDNKYRGKSAADTLGMWKNISDGEFKYIYPFQDDADIVVNTALIYEIGVLKTYVEPLLYSVEETDPSFPEATRLLRFLRNFLTIPSDDISKDSIIREFIGGSGFQE